MNTNGLITIISSIVAVIGALGAIYIALRKTPAEIGSLDAGTAKKYQEIANLAAERALKLDERIIELEATVLKQAGQIAVLQADNALLRNWADRLVHQVRSLGAVPVEMNPNKGILLP